MKIILYIGHHKVGSTALQIFLSQNWLALAQAGILYPSVESSGFSHNLASALQQDAPEPDMNTREPHSALAYQMISKVTKRNVPSQFKRLPAVGQMMRAMRKQVEILKPHTVVLCSEVFTNFGQVDPNLIPQLFAAFPDSEVEIYCALRRVDEYLVSWHGQRLKVGEQLNPLDAGGMAGYYHTIHFDFRTVVEAWNDRLPDARLIIRPYDEILKAGGSIDDFMAQVSVDFPADLAPVGRANKSLPYAAMEIVRKANHDLPKNLSHALSQYFLTGGTAPEPVPNKQIEMFGAALRQELVERFAPIHDYLSDLTGQPAFFADIDDIARERPIPYSEANRTLLTEIDPATLPDAALRGYIDSLLHDPAT